MSTTYKQPTKCTGKGSSGKEESDAMMLLILLVPHTKIEYNSREKPTFHDTQEEAGNKESRETLSETHEGTNDPPCEGDSWKPELWSCEFEDKIAWDLEKDAAIEVDGQCSGILVSGYFWVRVVLV